MNRTLEKMLIPFWLFVFLLLFLLVFSIIALSLLLIALGLVAVPVGLLQFFDVLIDVASDIAPIAMSLLGCCCLFGGLALALSLYRLCPSCLRFFRRKRDRMRELRRL